MQEAEPASEMQCFIKKVEEGKKVNKKKRKKIVSVNTTVSLSWGFPSDERAGLSYVRSYRYCHLHVFTYLLFEWERDKKPGPGGGQWQELK